MTDHGRSPIDRWLRSEQLERYVIELVTELTR